MITTTLAFIALAGGYSAGSIPSPKWELDYGKALTIASAEWKPVAVFIGQQKSTSAIPPEAAKLLREKYVCVHLNTDTAAGKAMAQQFQLVDGLVLSSPGGRYQALRHTGELKGATLTGTLTQYASAGDPTTTVSSGGSTSVVAASGYSASGAVYQSGYSAPVYQAAPSYYYSSPYGGVCTGPV